MLREKTGRVTFMPLNRLKPKNPPLPTTNEAFPLLGKLRYDEAYTPALQQVFGKTCVCRDLAIGAAYVKSHGINTITLDGDRVDRKGALSGGYHDVRRSRIEAARAVGNWRTRADEEGARSREVKAEMAKLDQEITRAAGRVQVLTNKQAKAREAREARVEEERALGREAERLREKIARLEGEIVEAEGELRGLHAKLEGYRAEMAGPLARGLTDAEEARIEQLAKEVEQRQKQLVEVGKQKNKVRSCAINHFRDSQS